MRTDSYAGLDIGSLSDRSGVEGLVLVAFLSIIIALALIFSVFFIIGAIIFIIYFREEIFAYIKSLRIKDVLETIFIDIPLFLLTNIFDILNIIIQTVIWSFALYVVYKIIASVFIF